MLTYHDGDCEFMLYAKGMNFFDVLRDTREKAERDEADLVVVDCKGKILCVYLHPMFLKNGGYRRGRFHYTSRGSDLYDSLAKVSEQLN